MLGFGRAGERLVTSGLGRWGVFVLGFGRAGQGRTRGGGGGAHHIAELEGELGLGEAQR